MTKLTLFTLIAFAVGAHAAPPAAGVATAPAASYPEAAPVAWDPASQADPADSLYRAARRALSREEYRQAAELFRAVVQRYPSSAYAGEALYYQAFALYRAGRTDDLRAARQALRTLADRYPDVARRTDAPALDTRLCGVLMKQGDEQCTVITLDRADPGAHGVDRDNRRLSYFRVGSMLGKQT